MVKSVLIFFKLQLLNLQTILPEKKMTNFFLSDHAVFVCRLNSHMGLGEIGLGEEDQEAFNRADARVLPPPNRQELTGSTS